MTRGLADPWPAWCCRAAPGPAPRLGRETAERETPLGRDSYRKVRLAVLGASLAVCLLAYAHAIPLLFGEVASCMIPLLWAIDAFRDEKRLMFAAAATLLLITALPLLHHAR